MKQSIFHVDTSVKVKLETYGAYKKPQCVNDVRLYSRFLFPTCNLARMTITTISGTAGKARHIPSSVIEVVICEL